jgi:hypothetical protein
VISFSMLDRGGPVGMGGNFVKFSGSLMRIASVLSEKYVE